MRLYGAEIGFGKFAQVYVVIRPCAVINRITVRAGCLVQDQERRTDNDGIGSIFLRNGWGISQDIRLVVGRIQRKVGFQLPICFRIRFGHMRRIIPQVLQQAFHPAGDAVRHIVTVTPDVVRCVIPCKPSPQRAKQRQHDRRQCGQPCRNAPPQPKCLPLFHHDPPNRYPLP